MIEEGFRIWLRNPSVAVPFVIHNFVRYGILTIVILYMAIELGTISAPKLLEHLKDFGNVIAISILIDLIAESYFISAEIKACRDAIDGNVDLDRAFKFAVRRTPSMFVIVLTIAFLLFPAIIGLLKRDIILIAISSIYLTVLAIGLTFLPFAVVIDELDPVKSIVKSIKVVKTKIKGVLAMWALVGLILIAYALILRLSMNFSIAFVFVLNLIVFPAIIMPTIFIWWILLYIR